MIIIITIKLWRIEKFGLNAFLTVSEFEWFETFTLENAPDGQQFLRWTLCPYFKGITYVSQMSKLKILTYNQDLSFFSTVLFPNISCKSTVSVYHFSFLQIWRLQKFFSKSEYRPACLLERFIKQTKPACSYEMAGNFKWVKLQHIMRSKRH